MKITQMELNKLADYEAKVARANDVLKEHKEKLDALKRDIIKRMQAGNEVEAGVRFVRLKEKRPRGSVKWEEIASELLSASGVDFKAYKEQLLEKSKASKKSTWELEMF